MVRFFAKAIWMKRSSAACRKRKSKSSGIFEIICVGDRLRPHYQAPAMIERKRGNEPWGGDGPIHECVSVLRVPGTRPPSRPSCASGLAIDLIAGETP